MSTQNEFQDRLQSIERLLAEIEASANPNLKGNVQELLQLVLDLHGAGLARVLELLEATPDQGKALTKTLARDHTVSSLLVLHGLHPLKIEARIAEALEKVSRKLRTQDATVELLGINDGAVRLRLEVSGHSCGSTGQALREAVEGAVYDSAPDVVALVIEGLEEKQGFVPIEMLQRWSPASPPELALIANGKAGA